MPSLRLIVCERRDVWAPALRAALGRAVDIRSTRSLVECERELAGAPACLVAAELTKPTAGRLAEFVCRASDRRRPARVVVLAARELAEYEWWMREAGAVHFETSPRRLGALARLVANQGRGATGPAMSVVERIWLRLPWADENSGTFSRGGADDEPVDYAGGG